jgi:hypothetical protein
MLAVFKLENSFLFSTWNVIISKFKKLKYNGKQ